MRRKKIISVLETVSDSILKSAQGLEKAIH